jgi:hypothetical protein
MRFLMIAISVSQGTRMAVTFDYLFGDQFGFPLDLENIFGDGIKKKAHECT